MAGDHTGSGLDHDRNTSAGPTTVNPTTATTGDDESAGSESESDSATTGTGDDEGCGCKVEDANSTRGLLGTLLAIGMGGFLRRRRRA